MSSALSTLRTGTAAKAARRFLVVDDNVDFVQALRVALELNGHQVEVAFDGVAGFEVAVRTIPDVVVLDVGLPKLNGYEVCYRIRQQHLTPEPMIIGATGWSQLVDFTLGEHVGFDAHLIKPFGYNELWTVLEAVPSRM